MAQPNVDNWLEELTPRVAFDRKWNDITQPLSQQEFLESRLVRLRLPFAKNKSWFGVLDSFEAMDEDWSIYQEVMRVVAGNPPEEDADNPRDKEPATREAFNLLRQSYDSTHQMVADFLEDHEHHLKVRMLILVGRTLQREYASGLEEQSEGQKATLQWQAQRAEGSFFTTVLNLFKLLDCQHVFAALDLRPGGLRLDAGHPSLQKDCARVKQLVQLIVELSHARVWSQMHHVLCLPHCFVKVFGKNPEAATAIFKRIELCLRSLLQAQEQNPNHALVQQLVRDVGTVHWVLTKEILSDGGRASWDCGDQTLKELCWSVFAGPGETKSCCESTFGWLADSARQSKANKFAGMTKYMYTQICPYPRSGGMNPLVPTGTDIRNWSVSDTKD